MAAFTTAASAQLTPAPAEDPPDRGRPASDDRGNGSLIGTLPADVSAGQTAGPPPQNPDLDFDNIGSPFPLCGFGLLFTSGATLVGLIATRRISHRLPASHDDSLRTRNSS